MSTDRKIIAVGPGALLSGLVSLLSIMPMEAPPPERRHGAFPGECGYPNRRKKQQKSLSRTQRRLKARRELQSSQGRGLSRRVARRMSGFHVRGGGL